MKRLPRLLLSAVLSAALILNGLGPAVAAVRMHVTQPALATQHEGMVPAGASIHAADPPCHAHALVATNEAKPGHTQAAMMHQGHDEKSKLPVPDCCKSGACQCACLQHGQAVVAMLRWDLSRPALAAMRPMMALHVPPTLPRLIRPPIS